MFGEPASVGIGIQSLGDSSIHILHHAPASRISTEIQNKVLPINQLQYFRVRKKWNFLKGALMGMGIGFASGYLLGLTNSKGSCSNSGSGYSFCPSGQAAGLIGGGSLGFFGIFIGGFTAKSYVTINANGKQEIYEAHKGELMPLILDR